MAINKNNGLFDKVKRATSSSQNSDFVGQEDLSNAYRQQYEKTLEIAREEIKAEQELAYAKLLEKKEAEIISKTDAYKMQLKQDIKEKYEKVARAKLQEREQELARKFKHELDKLRAQSLEQTAKIQKQQQMSADDAQREIVRLQQSLEQTRRESELAIEEARLCARRERERVLRTEFAEELLQKEREIRLEENKKNTNLMQDREDELAKEQQQRLSAQEQKLHDEYAIVLDQKLSDKDRQWQAIQDSALKTLEHKLKDEHKCALENAIANNTMHLKSDFSGEREKLLQRIDEFDKELSANHIALETTRERLRVEVRDEMRHEFIEKLNEAKEKLAKEQELEIQRRVIEERDKFTINLEEENNVVLKYKERELREEFETKILEKYEEIEKSFNTDFDVKILQRTQEISAEYNAKYEQRIEEKVTAAVVAERSRMNEQFAKDKQAFLSQKTAELDEQYSLKIIEAVKAKEQELRDMHDSYLREFEKQVDSQHIAAIQAGVAKREQELEHEFADQLMRFEQEWNLAKQEEILSIEQKYKDEYRNKLAQEKVEIKAVEDVIAECNHEQNLALEKQKKELSDKFQQELDYARQEWETSKAKALLLLETQKDNAATQSFDDKALECEKRLREEFQEKLNAERDKAEKYYARKAEQELKSVIFQYKEKLLQDVDNIRLQEAEEIESAIKARYLQDLENKLAELKSEYEKEQLLHEETHIAQLREQIESEFEQKLISKERFLQKKISECIEQERKKLSLKYAQDKADLIKELTAKFNHEKQVSIKQYENEIRDNLYKEMVKQKEYIQQKFAASQHEALREQERRLKAEHQHEIERIKKGFFDPKHNTIIAKKSNQGVEGLAGQLLDKFKTKDF